MQHAIDRNRSPPRGGDRQNSPQLSPAQRITQYVRDRSRSTSNSPDAQTVAPHRGFYEPQSPEPAAPEASRSPSAESEELSGYFVDIETVMDTPILVGRAGEECKLVELVDLVSQKVKKKYAGDFTRLSTPDREIWAKYRPCFRRMAEFFRTRAKPKSAEALAKAQVTADKKAAAEAARAKQAQDSKDVQAKVYNDRHNLVAQVKYKDAKIIELEGLLADAAKVAPRRKKKSWETLLEEEKLLEGPKMPPDGVDTRRAIAAICDQDHSIDLAYYEREQLKCAAEIGMLKQAILTCNNKAHLVDLERQLYQANCGEIRNTKWVGFLKSQEARKSRK